MLFDYSNQLNIPTSVSHRRQEQRGDKVTLQKKSESHQNTPFKLLEVWALVDPQIVNLIKVKNSTVVLLGGLLRGFVIVRLDWQLWLSLLDLGLCKCEHKKRKEN